MPLSKRCTAEILGTFWLVFGGCGSAVMAAAFPHIGIGFLGVSLAFGLTVLTMAFAIGHISGCHLNPAVTVGLAVGKRFAWSDVMPYVAAQVVGAAIASGVLYVIASGAPGFSLSERLRGERIWRALARIVLTDVCRGVAICTDVRVSDRDSSIDRSPRSD